MLAIAVNAFPTYMSGLERGLRNPTLGTMEKIADALGTTIAKLVAKAERG